jgi:hypothetical protein
VLSAVIHILELTVRLILIFRDIKQHTLRSKIPRAHLTLQCPMATLTINKSAFSVRGFRVILPVNGNYFLIQYYPVDVCN